MTPEQIDRARQIIEEEFASATESLERRFVRNGDDFPDLANLTLANSRVTGLIAASALVGILSAISSEKPPDYLSDPSKLARHPIFNKGPLDLLWLGYRLGRRMEHEEMEAMKELERR